MYLLMYFGHYCISYLWLQMATITITTKEEVPPIKEDLMKKSVEVAQPSLCVLPSYLLRLFPGALCRVFVTCWGLIGPIMTVSGHSLKASVVSKEQICLPQLASSGVHCCSYLAQWHDSAMLSLEMKTWIWTDVSFKWCYDLFIYFTHMRWNIYTCSDTVLLS